jgi:hypothetical protein
MWNCIRLILIWELTSWLKSLLQREGTLYIRFSQRLPKVKIGETGPEDNGQIIIVLSHQSFLTLTIYTNVDHLMWRKVYMSHT